MTKLSRKLLISVFTLAFALVTLGATTFAWFTLSGTVGVDEFELSTATGFGIEISADGINWGNSVTAAELGVNLATKMDAVTSTDGVSFKDLNKESMTSGFITFNLHFRSTTEDLKVYLGSETETFSTPKSWTPDTTFTYRGVSQNPETPIDIFAADSLRISFQEHTSDEFNDEEGLVTIWELDPSDDDDKNVRLDNAFVTNDGLFMYWEAKGLPLSIAGHSLPTVVYDNDDLGADTDNPNLLTLSETIDGADNYYFGYLTVRIWLEGWDPDNFDAIFNSKFSVNLFFEVQGAE
ncbi:MAG: hypothetical protein WC006_05000 [Bacilli bacterium]|nr:hypothetical protein [Bacilli bacterium]